MYRYINLGNWCVITRNNILVLDSELGQRNSFSEDDAKILCDELNGGEHAED